MAAGVATAAWRPSVNRRPADAADLPWAACRAAALAAELCRHGCAWYHGFWGFARLYGVLPAVGRSHTALLDLFERAAAAGRRRILLCGAADQGLLAYALAGTGTAGFRPEITVTDLCPTPLKLSDEYARRRGGSVATIPGDATTLAGGPYDLIVAHNFANFFDEDGRRRLALAWARMLAPTGEVALFATSRPTDLARQPRFADPDALAAALAAARAASPHADLIEPERLASMARTFAARRQRHNISSVSALLAPMEAAGLRAQVQPERRVEAAGLASDGGGRRVVVTLRLQEGEDPAV